MNDGNIRLADVYADMDNNALVLWELLKHRKPEQSISHKKMPSLREHLDFVESRPYKGWFVILKKTDSVSEIPVGAVYLTKNDEIGISVDPDYQRQGIGPRAIKIVMALPWGDKPRFLANINPQNEPSIRMFEKLGFKHIQQTYERGTP